jgi:hypothetical protein
MTKRKTMMTDEEALKHYIPGQRFPPSSGPSADRDLPVVAKELLKKSLTSNAEFIKPALAVDRVMANRKSAVMKPRKGKQKNAKHL